MKAGTYVQVGNAAAVAEARQTVPEERRVGQHAVRNPPSGEEYGTAARQVRACLTSRCPVRWTVQVSKWQGNGRAQGTVAANQWRAGIMPTKMATVRGVPRVAE